MQTNTQPIELLSRGNSARNIDIAAFSRMKTLAEKLQFFVRFAILSPSNHNTQPWLFDLDGDHIELRSDRSRSLPATDPFDRELIISCGACLAFLAAAAKAFGSELQIDRYPNHLDTNLLARISIKNHTETQADTQIIDAILKRRTNRNAFDAAPLPLEHKELLQLTAKQNGISTTWIDELDDRRRLAQIIMDADKSQFEDPSFLRELAFWIRGPQTDANDGIPARAIGISGVASYIAPLVVRTFDLGDGKAARDNQLIERSSGIIVFSTAFDEERDWLACGEALGSFLIAAEKLSLQVSYLNQPCEVNEMRFRLSLLDSIQGNPQLVLRVGNTQIAPTFSPRRPLEEILR